MSLAKKIIASPCLSERNTYFSNQKPPFSKQKFFLRKDFMSAKSPCQQQQMCTTNGNSTAHTSDENSLETVNQFSFRSDRNISKSNRNIFAVKKIQNENSQQFQYYQQHSIKLQEQQRDQPMKQSIDQVLKQSRDQEMKQSKQVKVISVGSSENFIDEKMISKEQQINSHYFPNMNKSRRSIAQTPNPKSEQQSVDRLQRSASFRIKIIKYLDLSINASDKQNESTFSDKMAQLEFNPSKNDFRRVNTASNECINSKSQQNSNFILDSPTGNQVNQCKVIEYQNFNPQKSLQVQQNIHSLSQNQSIQAKQIKENKGSIQKDQLNLLDYNNNANKLDLSNKKKILKISKSNEEPDKQPYNIINQVISQNEFNSQNYLILNRIKHSSEIETFKVIDINTFKLHVVKKITTNKHQSDQIIQDIQNKRYPFKSDNNTINNTINNNTLKYENITPQQKNIRRNISIQQGKIPTQYGKILTLQGNLSPAEQKSIQTKCNEASNEQDAILYLKCQFQQNDSLSSLLEQCKILNETSIIYVFRQVLNSLTHIYKEQNCILRNGFTFDNILFDDNHQVSLAYKFTSDSLDDDFKRIKQLSLTESIQRTDSINNTAQEYQYQSIPSNENLQNNSNNNNNNNNNNNKKEIFSQDEADIVLNFGYLILKCIISPSSKLLNSSCLLSNLIKQKKQLKNKSCCVLHDIERIVEQKLEDSFVDYKKAQDISKFIKTNFSKNMQDLLCKCLCYHSRHRLTLLQLKDYFHNITSAELNTDQTVQDNCQILADKHSIAKLFLAVKVKRISAQKQTLTQEAERQIKAISANFLLYTPNKIQIAKTLTQILSYEGILTKKQIFQQLMQEYLQINKGTPLNLQYNN